MANMGGISPGGEASLDYKHAFDVGVFAAKYGGVTIATLKPGVALYSQGEPADALFYLQDGQVQMTVVSRQGKEGILHIVDPGDFCGEGCLLGNRPRVVTALCITPCTVARFERANVLRALREDPALAEYFLAFALTSVVRLRENLISQLFESSEQRLARVLMMLANYRKRDRKQNLIRNVDQESLAQMIGTTRSRVNHFMNKFRKLGCIDYDGSVIVVRGSMLEAVLQDVSLDIREPSSPTAA